MNKTIVVTFLAAVFGQGCSFDTFAFITWSFPTSSVCSLAEPPHTGVGLGGIAYVDVAIDGQASTRLSCVGGSVADSSTGIKTPPLTAGVHTLSLIASASNSFPMFSGYSSFTTQLGSDVRPAAIPFTWTVGGAVVGWNLTNGGVAESCFTAGNPTIITQFTNAQTGSGIYAAPGDPAACGSSPIRYYYLPTTAAGTTYTVTMSAVVTSPSPAVWNSTAAIPSKAVLPGTFPPDSEGLPGGQYYVTLRRN